MNNSYKNKEKNVFFVFFAVTVRVVVVRRVGVGNLTIMHLTAS